jgi:hypothetical protein
MRRVILCLPVGDYCGVGVFKEEYHSSVLNCNVFSVVGADD